MPLDRDLLETPLDDLLAEARRLRRAPLVTYSPKVFIPLTTLCRDVCGYCTFARPPRRGDRAFLREEEVLEIARAGAAAGCREALFTLGDKPELRYKIAREELGSLGCRTTLEYLARCARLVLDETGLLPHLNPGVMSRADLELLRPVSASMGIMLETTAERLSGAGRAALGLARQAPCAPARDDAARGRARDSVHERDPDRHRRDARRAARCAVGAEAAGGRVRPHPGGDRPELPCQAGDADGVAQRAVARGSSLDDRRGANPPRSRRARPGAAEPRLRRLSAPARRRHRRLGRGLARDDRPRQPRGAVAGSRAAAGGDPLARARARCAAARVSGVRRRSVAGPGRDAVRPPGGGRTRPCPRGRLGARRARRESRSSSAATRRRSSSPATSWARRSSSGCSGHVATSANGYSRPATVCVARSAATR